MTDPNPTPVPDIGGLSYPDTSVGMLMKQRDDAKASANAARGEMARFEAMAQGHETTAARLQVAIDALGGDEPIETLPDPNAVGGDATDGSQDTLSTPDQS